MTGCFHNLVKSPAIGPADLLLSVDLDLVAERMWFIGNFAEVLAQVMTDLKSRYYIVACTYFT